jgi:hypothetical protein
MTHTEVVVDRVAPALGLGGVEGKGRCARAGCRRRHGVQVGGRWGSGEQAGGAARTAIWARPSLGRTLRSQPTPALGPVSQARQSSPGRSAAAVCVARLQPRRFASRRFRSSSRFPPSASLVPCPLCLPSHSPPRSECSDPHPLQIPAFLICAPHQSGNYTTLPS